MWIKTIHVLSHQTSLYILFLRYTLSTSTCCIYHTLNAQYHKGKKTIWFAGFDEYEKPKPQQLKPFNQVLNRGDICVRDFRSIAEEKSKEKNKLRVVSLNMEMGKQINKIVSSLKSLNADIILLQEVDVSTPRCKYIDIVAELATELNMNSMFTCEVIFDSEKGLLHEATGYEGNAILSKYDFIDTKGIVVKCARYEKYKHKRKTHTEALAVMNVPNLGKIACVSMHLDPHWCGVNGRVRQYHEILSNIEQYRNESKDNDNSFDHLIMGGDLNTVCHGLNRLYPSIGCDNDSRFGHIGQTEAEYFNENGVERGNDEYKMDLRDPFDKVEDYTMYALNGGYTAKVDWCLLSGDLEVLDMRVCPVEDRCSDHQWVMVDIATK